MMFSINIMFLQIVIDRSESTDDIWGSLFSYSEIDCIIGECVDLYGFIHKRPSNDNRFDYYEIDWNKCISENLFQNRRYSHTIRKVLCDLRVLLRDDKISTVLE